MIDIADVAFNLCLITLFAVVVAHASVFYQLKKNRFYLYIMILFLLYIVDDVIIYMTEALDFFAQAYNEIFMSSPTVKTVLYIGMAICMIQIQNSVFHKKFSAGNGLAVIFFGLWLMFIPMMPHGVVKVWLFYLPFQVFTVSLSLYGLYFMKKHEAMRHEHTANRYFHALLIITFCFSIAIAIEDFYVIFFVDDYSSLAVSIYQRNHCEDVLRIVYSLAWIRFFLNKFSRERAKLCQLAGEEEEQPVELHRETVHAEEVHTTSVGAHPVKAETVPKQPRYERNYKMILYAESLRLTGRESEILKLLLADKNNQEISEALMISIGTVKTHVHNIFQKVDVKRRAELLQCFEEFKPGADTSASNRA